MKNTLKHILCMGVVGTMLLATACHSPENKPATAGEKQTDTADHEHTYSCPMHPEVRGKEGDKCPKCGMPLEHMDEAATKGNFKMEWVDAKQTVEAGKPVTLSFVPKNMDNPAAEVPLDVEHEKKIHLIVVSEDLAWFHHIHPEYNAEGKYTVTETFPHGGHYLLFADYRPSGASGQVEKIPVTVSGKTVPAQSYTQAKLSSVTDGITLTLSPEGGKFVSGEALHLQGALSQNSKPLDAATLDNYLGAKAHMVVIGISDQNFLHVHPGIENGNLHLETTFDKPGLYRDWIQYQQGGKLHTADFVFNVEPGTGEPAQGMGAHHH